MFSCVTFMSAYHRYVRLMVEGYENRQLPQLTMFLYGYFDESGKFHDANGLITLCGFVADGDQWNLFETEWNQLLKSYGFAKIRMANYYSQCHLRGWDERKTDGVLCEFVDKIRERVSYGFGIGLDGAYLIEKYKAMGKQRRDPNRICTQRLLKRIRNTFMALGQGEIKVSLTFDDDEEYAVTCYRIISRLKKDEKNADLKQTIANVGFATDDVFAPLQAADILAYFTRESLVAKKIHPVIERFGEIESPCILKFDGGEEWNKDEIDKNWALIENVEDMPRKQI